METVDDYIQQVIRQGDKGSELLASLTAPTLKNSNLVDVVQEGMNGIAVLRIPEDHFAVVHSIGGDPKEHNLASYTASMVDNLVKTSKDHGFKPVGFSNVIDSREANDNDVRIIGKTLVEKANEYGLPILNGELAILGERVNCTANIMGTMISIVHEEENSPFGGCITPKLAIKGVDCLGGIAYAGFDPKGKPVYINSDGVGTKTEFYERARKYELAVHDFMAMNLDDASRIGAEVKVVSGVVETKGEIPFNQIEGHASDIAKDIGFLAILQIEYVGDRIRGYEESADSYNLSGSVISTIDEGRLREPLKPSEGEYLIAIAGKPNPRSNGITAKREMMVNLFGDSWHESEEGKLFLKYLAEPSTILYPVFKELIDEGIATSVYHMSGGAFNGKLARPLAKHGLFVKLEKIFLPDYRELALSGAGFTSAEAAYTKWPMGNDGFITTTNPESAMNIINSNGLNARNVGRLEKDAGGRTGVELTAVSGEKVYFNGK